MTTWWTTEPTYYWDDGKGWGDHVLWLSVARVRAPMTAPYYFAANTDRPKRRKRT